METEDVKEMIENKALHYMQRDMIGTNIIWTNGDVDPWMELSITPDSVTNDSRVDRQHWKLLLIQNGSHCSDLSTPADSDSSYLVDARNEMREEINYWVKYSTKGKDAYNTHTTLFLVTMILYGLGGLFVILGIVFSVCTCRKRKSATDPAHPINNSDSASYGSL